MLLVFRNNRTKKVCQIGAGFHAKKGENKTLSWHGLRVKVNGGQTITIERISLVHFVSAHIGK
jgi:hypothetical protein